MKSAKIMPGQFTLFDIVSLNCIRKEEKQCDPRNLSEFDKRYYGYVPSSYDEIDRIVDELAELIQSSYNGMAVEIVDFNIYHKKARENDDAYSYCISWYIQKPGATDVTEQVQCCVRRLSPICVSYWHEGDNFIYTASAHTVKKVGRGQALANDKSVFCEKLSDITSVSLDLLDGLSDCKKPVAKKSKDKLSPIQKFIKENNGIVIDDMSNEASINAKKSESFMNFCKGLKSALRKEAKAIGFDDVTLRPNHYDMSGFFKKADKYVYWSFSVVRGGVPTYLDKTGVSDGFLYRTAESEKDFKGGNNHFTDLANLVTDAYKLI